MTILKILTHILFLPGTLVLKMIGVSVEQDSGIFRSFINACFWGAICLPLALKYFG